MVLIVSLVSWYLYRTGRISFLPKKRDVSQLQNLVSELPFTDKQYKLSYKEKSLNDVFVVSKFEDGEEWRGDGELDYADFLEGQSSLSLTSQGNAVSEASLRLTDGFKLADFGKVKLLVKLRSVLENIEEFNLVLTDGNNIALYKYPVRGLTEGWNLLALPVENFSEVKAEDVLTVKDTGGSEIEGQQTALIKKVTFEIISRPRTMASVGIDFMWLEKSEDYLEDWKAVNNEAFFMGKSGDKVALGVCGLNNFFANIKKITAVRNFSLKAKFTPQRGGFFGFFIKGNYQNGHGYYVGLDGVNSNGWRILKYGDWGGKQQEIILKKGEISNFQTENDHPYWLKVDVKGSRLTFSFSVDGISYASIGEVTDDSFPFGGVGVVAKSSMFFIDDIDFQQ